MMRTGLAVLVLAVISSVSMAQVTVVESRPAAQASTVTNSVAPSNSQQTDLFYRLQALQQEVLELRGMVEEQGNELNRLKQQRHDDYMDLDRRIASFAAGGAVAGAGVGAVPQSSVVSGSDDGSVYKAAYAQLRERNLKGALQGFTAYLDQFPKGQYAANSQYWMGEIYLADGKLELAKQWFERVAKEFPKDRKAPDAQFKLGTVLFQLGDKDKARTVLQSVASSGADASRLAREFLAQNY